MSKPIEKTPTQTLVHRPWDVLELFGNYDDTNRSWLKFDSSVSKQIRDFEAKNKKYIRPALALNRRSSR